MRRWKKIFHANGNQNWSNSSHIKQNKPLKNITRDKEGHYIMSKGSIQGKCITTLNIYVPSVREPQYIRQMLIGIKGGNC